MLHQLLFLAFYIGLVPAVLISPFAGVLIYDWLDWLPPGEVYSTTLFPGYLSLFMGALTFLVWLVRENKTLPRPLLVVVLMAAMLVWVNITSLYSLVPSEAGFEWSRTVKVIAFAILTTQMLSTRVRLEALVWALILSVFYFAVPGAIKVIVSGGSGGIEAGEVVVAAQGSFFGDRVIFSVVLGVALPFALYLARQTILVPLHSSRLTKAAMLGAALCFLVALIGTFARTALVTGAVTLFMLAIRSRRKTLAVGTTAAAVLVLLAIAPDNWFIRMDTIIHHDNDGSAMNRLAVWHWAWQMALSHPIFGGGFGVFHLNAGVLPGHPGWLEAHNIFFQVMAEHGFVGLGLFCWIVFAVYRCCGTVRKRVRHLDALTWTADLASATQIGLVAFVIGGSFVSIATTPFLYTLAAIAVGTRSLVEREIAAEAQSATFTTHQLLRRQQIRSLSPHRLSRPLHVR